MANKSTGNFDAQKYMREYIAEKIIYKRVNFARGKEDDEELLTWIEAQPEKTAPYIKRLIREDMQRRLKIMKRVSIDNGLHFVEPDDAVKALPWEVIVQNMDDEVRERVNNELAPCSEAAFLTRYLELAPADLIIG